MNNETDEESVKKEENWKDICKNCEVLRLDLGCGFGCEIVKMSIKKTIIQHTRDPLYKNSFFLMLNSALAAILGFVFITIITRLYTPADIGLFSAIVSAAGLLAVFSRLGFDVGLIRFLPASKEPENLINSCFTVTSIVALLFALVFLAGINLWSPALGFIRDDAEFILLFIAVTVFTVVSGLQMNIFVGRRSTKYLVVRDVINSILKIIFVILLAGIGILGIFSAHTIGIFLSFFTASFILIQKVEPKYLPKPMIKKKLINDMFHYSIGNHVAGIFGTAPGLILPIMVVNVLGAEQGAYFYVVWAITRIIFVASGAISTSFFAEGSNAPDMVYMNARRSLKLAYLLLIPIVVGVFLIGDKILLVFGDVYSQNATELLWVFAVSSLLLAFNSISFNIERVRKNLKTLNIYIGFMAFSIIIFSYLFMIQFGLIGIGLGWFVAQLLTAVIIIISRKKSIAL